MYTMKVINIFINLPYVCIYLTGMMRMIKINLKVYNTGLTKVNFPFTFHFHALEKEMATHSSVLAWRIPGTGEPGGPPSLGSHRVGHD